jgi:hypothetical protein
LKTVKNLFGMRTNSQKAQARAQDEAVAAQKRAANAATEDAALARAEQAASGRRLRGLGRRALAFQGVETGLAANLAG